MILFSGITLQNISRVIPGFILIYVLWFADVEGQQNYPVINEIQASNTGTVADEDGDYEDWIEIYNGGSQSVNLSGYGLSDDPERPFRWVFPDITILPDEYLLVWASGKNRIDPSGPLHTGFSISSEGEDITLTDPEGEPAGKIPAAYIPVDISYGRETTGGSDLVYFMKPTPGYANHDESFQGITEPPEFSVPGGFYNGTRIVGISHSDPEAVIRYTVDATLPHSLSPVYQDPLELGSLVGVSNGISMIRTNPPEVPESIEWYPPVDEIDKAHVIRAVAFKPGYISSPAATATYFIDLLSSLPVFSIVTDDDNLFDHNKGIYVPGLIYEQNGYGEGWYGQNNANYFQRGMEWEIPVSLEFMEEGVISFSQDIGIRIHGGGTRALPMKSLRLYARGGYGATHMEHDFFSGQGDQSFSRLILRNSGQDFFGPGTLLRDGFMQKLAGPLGIPIQDYSPSVVFLNGEYWGIHNIRERYDHHYFERKYDIPEEHLDYLENNQVVINGSDGHYSDMITFVEENSLSDPESYEYLQELMDVENYTDYYIVNIFCNNIDWPGHNIMYFRYNGEQLNNPSYGKDGRWRWALNDFDFGFGNTSGLYPYNQNTLVHATDPDGTDWPPNPPWSTFLIRSLLGNEEFKTGFINRFGDLLNSVFQPEYMMGFLEEMKRVIEPEISRHMRRWQYPAAGMNEWQENIDRMMRFAERRPEYQTSHIIDYFELEGTFSLNIDVNDPLTGTVMVNRLLLEESDIVLAGREDLFPWKGTYFLHVPVTLSAVPHPGHDFVKWINGNGEEYFENPVVIDSDGDISMTAVFGLKEEFFPEAFKVTENDPFLFTRWDPSRAAGTYPENMAFVYTAGIDPGPDAGIEGFTGGGYDLDSRTRINGMGCGGISFINTGNEDGNSGYPGGRLGGAILALDTGNAGNMHLMFQAATVSRNSRIYNLRLQYRLDDHSEFTDLLNADGEPVEYLCGKDGHSRNHGPFPLPEFLHGQGYLQLLWRYYYTGEREDEESGQRSELRIGSIAVFDGESFPLPDLLAGVSIEVPDEQVCDNDTAGIRAFFAEDSSSTVYRWFAENVFLTETDSEVLLLERPQDGITLHVEVNDINSCLFGMPAISDKAELSVLPAPETPEIENKDSLLFSNALHGNQWYEAGPGMISGADQQVFVPRQTGNYYVIVSDGQCYSDPSDTVTFEVAGIDPGRPEEGSEFSLFPNPAGSVLHVRMGERHAGDIMWSIYDSGGRMAEKGTGITGEGEHVFMIDIAGLEPGIYLLRLISGSERFSGSFIRE